MQSVYDEDVNPAVDVFSRQTANELPQQRNPRDFYFTIVEEETRKNLQSIEGIYSLLFVQNHHLRAAWSWRVDILMSCTSWCAGRNYHS